MIEWVGWVATAVFGVSYFCRRPAAMRRVQALAAALWIVYGVAIKAPPVIVANLVVASIAIISSFQRRDPRQALKAQTESSR
ncbi:MAG TPA: YgjV family protein [Blastocatellia bacterium]